MSYQASVYDGSAWQTLGFQTPLTPFLQKAGSDSVTLTADPTTKSITFSGAAFTSAPQVFITATNGLKAWPAVTAASTTGFTISVAGLTSGTYTFNWYAIQP